MNFFGHAAVASWFRAPPPLVLGAMLPDFFSMLRVRHPAVRNEAVRAGIALHHATDAAFHDIPEFVELVAKGRAALADAGLARGSARAAAHIGVELLLDEGLSHDAMGRNAYFSALDYARGDSIAIDWPADDGTRFSELVSALAARGLPDTPPEPARVAQRLRHALASRPKLAFSIGEESAVGQWVVGARRAVVGCTPVILAELRQRLRARGFDSEAASTPRRDAKPSIAE